MPNQYSCIYLRIKSIVYYIIGFSDWCLRKSEGRSIVEFRYPALFAVTADLNLFGINLVGTAKPSFCYP